MFVCVCEFMGCSVHRAVLSLRVRVCVRAGGVHGDVGGADDDGSSLLLLGARSPLLSAFDVLDGLHDGVKVLSGRGHSAGVDRWAHGHHSDVVVGLLG